MPDIRRKEGNPIRTRRERTDGQPGEDFDDGAQEPEAGFDERTEQAAAPAPAAPVAPPADDGQYGFDQETNNRYEEIKRGTTHISALQQMTMPQLIATAKMEGVTDYTGLKKQDLI